MAGVGVCPRAIPECRRLHAIRTACTVALLFCCLAAVGAAGARARVCIDPGHPSEVSSGAGVQNGTTEVHIAWQVALKLKKLLEEKGVSVVMTKSSERQLVRNRDRAAIANKAGADLMIRLHCDAGRGRGFALYYPDRQGRKYGVRGPSAQIIAASRAAAKAIHAGMRPALAGKLRDGGVRGDSRTYVGRRQGALTGSIFARVPIVTVEMVFLTNPSDAAFIKSESGQEQMAQALRDGVLHYLGTDGPDGGM